MGKIMLTLSGAPGGYTDVPLITFIALLTNNTGFGPRFSYSDWQNLSRDQSNLKLTGPKIRIVGLRLAELEMDKTVHLEFIHRCVGGVNINFNRIFQCYDL